MDCVIAGPSVRSFSAALACLSRIGKDISVQFHPVDGLTLRALSDAKSVFCSFHYEPSFFEKCSSSLKRRRNESNTGTLSDILCVRVSIKALTAVVRPRKDIVQLCLTSDEMSLAFEFQLARGDGTVTRVVHTVGTSIAQSVDPVTSMDKASELVVPPSVILKLMEPLQRTTEMALLVQDSHKIISGVSFAHDDVVSANSVQAGNIAGAATKAALKTETSIRYDEVMEVHYVSLPPVGEEDSAPSDLSERTILVFTTKEFRAVLDYCAKATYQALPVTLQFYWGGKPMVLSAKTSHGLSVELVMATMDHKLLEHMQVAASSGGNK